MSVASVSTTTTVTPVNIITDSHLNNECYEYQENKTCSAGLLCKYNHNGNGDHRLIKFCKRLVCYSSLFWIIIKFFSRFLTGHCRNGDDCPFGSHTLLRYQMPVCDYYLRKECYYDANTCPFLHVKLADNAPICVFFNKGKCLKKPPVCLDLRFSG